MVRPLRSSDVQVGEAVDFKVCRLTEIRMVENPGLDEDRREAGISASRNIGLEPINDHDRAFSVCAQLSARNLD